MQSTVHRTEGRSMLLRAVSNLEVSTEGRTLLGRALPWDTVETVSDYGGPEYREAFAPSSSDESLRRNPEPRPLFVMHNHIRGDLPIGVAHFQREPAALLFAAPISRTRAGDEALSLAKDGALTDVSLGFRPIHNARKSDGRPYIYRTEIAVRELSLAPNGFGQYPSAKVLALRSVPDDMSFSDVTDAVQAAVVEALGSKTEYAYVRDLSDDWVVYCVDGGVLYKVSYVIDSNGEVTLAGDTQEVTTHTDYVPVSQDANRTDSGLTLTTSSTPRLDAWRLRKARMASF